MAAVSDIALAPDDDVVALAAGEGLGLSPDMPLIPPLPARDTAFWITCIAAAALLHLTVLTVLSWPATDNALGGGGTELEAISVDMVQASALQAIADAATIKDAAAVAQLADRQGADRQQEAAAEAPDLKPEKTPEAAPKSEVADLIIPDAQIKPEPLPSDAPVIVIAPDKADRKIESPEPPTETKAPPGITVASAASAPSEAAEAQSLGGATVTGTSALETAAQSAAIALTGELAAYARQVQQAVARNPPRITRANGRRGDVIIAFALGLDGTLLHADILSSSGSASLDEAALGAVRATRFPAPPAGSQPAQLVYRFPFKYR